MLFKLLLFLCLSSSAIAQTSELSNQDLLDKIGTTQSYGIMRDAVSRIQKGDENLLNDLKTLAKQGKKNHTKVLVNYYLGNQNHKGAMPWIEELSNQNDVLSQSLAGKIYFEGRPSVKKNYQLAYDYSLRAAKQGNLESFGRLSKMYEEGKGVEKNYIEAYAWINASFLSMGKPDYIGKSKINKKLSAEEINSAQSKAVSYFQSYIVPRMTESDKKEMLEFGRSLNSK